MSQFDASREAYTAGTTLTAFFDDRDDAQDAVSRLHALGLSQSQVRLTEGRASSAPATTEDHRGFFDMLADFFMPDEDRYAYAEGLSRGGYLVSVSNVPEAYYNQALDILDDEGSIDIDERADSWRQEGWTGYTGASAVAATADDDDVVDDDAIPIVQEELRVGKRDVSHGRVRVRSYVVEEPVEENVSLHEERVQLERRPVDRPASAADAAFQDRTIEAEERAEEAVVDKQARVVEEVSLRKDSTDREATISDTIKHTEVEVEDDRDALRNDRDISNRRV